ncbi:SDR family NAD(P)-dependent oxidoreductase [Micromonospora echinospora]|uniref:type I polyketide synthase n=1 Tax=Micromonospora echinospora TaxID=1877 RepID=UPI0037BC8E43
MTDDLTAPPTGDIAIVGLAGRFPGAADVDELWSQLRAGRSGITHFDDDELRAAGVPEALLADPSYVRAGAVLSGIDLFDADFFGIPPHEATVLDPQQRLFLEAAATALEDAGCVPERFDGAIGVFGGSAWSSYLQNNLWRRPDVLAGAGELAVGLANEKDSLTTRVAHTLGLSGPTFAVQSFCSTSLVAVAVAATSLANSECDVAVAGGVSVAVPHRVGYLYQAGGMTSPDGRCRAFDAQAQGTPVGSGVGVVALRRLEDALADGDRIYAVLRGWAVNNDAGRKVGFTAPGVQGQAEVVAEALAAAGLTAADIDYLEAHGTGTALGDAAELAALQQVFHGQACRIGSLKTNVGHLDRSAGVAGLIKTALALHHGELPPTLNFATPNPQLDQGGARLRVVTELTPWPRGERPRHAGVSAFGIGGTNAHVVLAEAPPSDGPRPAVRPELLLLSARSAEALREQRRRLADHLGDADGRLLAETAYTLQTGRTVFEHRAALVAATARDATEALRQETGLLSRVETRTDRPVAFLVAGVGEQYPGLAADLYHAEPAFRTALDECRELLRQLGVADPVGELLTPAESAPANDLLRALGRAAPTGPGTETQTERAQPGVFAVEYALARLLGSAGVVPAVLAGYSLGEYVAACLAGVLSLPDALALVVHRARLIAEQPGGAMAAVPLGESALRRRLRASGVTDVDVAAVNGPELAVLGGPVEAVRRIRDDLERDGVPARLLATTHAFHTGMLRPVREPLVEWIRRNVTLRPPRLPYVSNVTGRLITADEATDPWYWADHMCEPVRFDRAIATVLGLGDHVVVELGPGQSLGAMVRTHPSCDPARWPAIVPTVSGAAERRPAVFTEALARLWLLGVLPDWAAYQSGRGLRRTTVPTYPYQRRRYWIDPPAEPAPPAVTTPPAVATPTGTDDRGPEPSPGIRPAPEPTVALAATRWRPAPDAPAGETPSGTVLLLLGDGPGGDEVAERLRAAGHRVVPARPGAGHPADPPTTTGPALSGEYVPLLSSPEVTGGTGPVTVVDLRALDPRPAGPDGAGALETLRLLAQLLSAAGTAGPQPVRVFAVTRDAHPVTPTEQPDHWAAALAPICLVARQEYLALDVRAVDLAGRDDHAALAEAILTELRHPTGDAVVAYRDGVRHLPEYPELPAVPTGDPTLVVRPGGTYLITGGLGDVGTLLAEHLARRGAGRVVLTSRSVRPHAALRTRLADLGADLVVHVADVADADRMTEVVRAVTADGRLDGVLHAAGDTRVETFRPLAELDTAGLAGQFRPKVAGAVTLERVLRGLPAAQAPDFCLLFSSVSAVLGGVTFAGYAAANAAMAAFAARVNGAARAGGEAGTRWLVAGWDTWEPTLARLPATVGASMVENSLPVADALAAVDRVLAGAYEQVHVVAGDLTARLRRWTISSPETGTATGQRFPRPELTQPYAPAVTGAEQRLVDVWSQALRLDRVGIDDNFFELGGSSLLALQMLTLVKERLGVVIPPVTLFAAPTVRALAGHCAPPEPAAATARPATTPVDRDRPTPGSPAIRPATTGDDRHIAIIGMAGRFPGAPDVTEFWSNVTGGVESIRFFTEQELREAGVDPTEAADPNYVPARPVLDDVSGFDAGLFGYGARAATIADPQQRIFLETSWEALEHAGYGAPEGRGRVGVFGGANISTYLLGAYQRMRSEIRANDHELVMANDKDALTTVVSYTLDLGGPSVAVQTFCSTSLVAVHLAAQSLRAGECEMALAGGVSIRVPDRVGHLYQQGGMASPDGHVRTFDADARGSMFGDGCAVVVLKPLAAAQRDGDTIWAVVRGSAVNNDGALKVGYTAPSVVGQARVVADALADAGVDPRAVGYVEAHGTATELGDPIEVAALTRAFGQPADGGQYCALGSVKTNVGHLDRAAGVTGLIKAALAVHHGVLPPTLHYRRPNPQIDFAASPFYVNTELRSWPAVPGRRRTAGVSSLGMGGTNAHVVIEEPPAPARRPDDGGRHHVLTLSARSDRALAEAADRLGAYLGAHPQLPIADVAFTLQTGRSVFAHRATVVARSVDEAVAALSGRSPQRLRRRTDPMRRRPVVLLLGPGGRRRSRETTELYRREPVFRAALDECATPEPDGGPGPGASPVGEMTPGTEFGLMYATARLLLSWHVDPAAVIGYGLGGYVAGCLAGVFSARDALRMVRESQRRSGAELAEWIADQVTLRPADRSFLAGTDGIPVPPATLLSAGYWATVATSAAPVAPAVPGGGAEPAYVALGVGADLAEAVPAGEHDAGPVVVTDTDRPLDELLADALARLWLAGVDVDWTTVATAAAGTDTAVPAVRRVPLPPYPFQRDTYWLPADPVVEAAPAPATGEPSFLDTVAAMPRLPERDWLYLPVWRQQSPGTPGEHPDGCWLVYTDDGPAETVTAALTRALSGTDARVVLVRPGDRFSSGPDGYRISPREPEDTYRLVRVLDDDGLRPGRVVHLWSLTGHGPAARKPSEPDGTDPSVARGLHALVSLARALGDLGIDDWRLDVVATGTHDVLGGDPLRPANALVVGPCRVIPLEYPGVRTRLLDVEPADAAGPTLAVIVRDLLGDGGEQVVAVRRGRRYAPDFDRLPAVDTDPATPGPLRPAGVYLVTGGLGGIGLAMAERLVTRCGARLVLMGRGGAPPRERWDEIVRRADPADPQVRVAAALRRLVEMGASVEVVAGDVADTRDVEAAVATALDRYGALHGVLHAAGVPGAGLMQFKNLDDLDRVLAPKVPGTLALERALRVGDADEIELDFLVLFSSITSVTGGGPGQVEYCAANAFLDTYAQQARNTGRRVLAVDWGEWTWNAWADGLDAYDPDLQRFFRDHRERTGIDFDQGFDAMLRALDSGEARVVVSTVDFGTQVALSRRYTVDAVRPGADTPDGSDLRHPRPDLVTDYLAPQNPTETRIAEVWATVLRLDRVGVRDNFFDLGGSSLLGVDLVARLRREFRLAELAPHVLYGAATVQALAKVIQARVAGQGEAGPDRVDSSTRARQRRQRLRNARQRRGAGDGSNGGERP